MLGSLLPGLRDVRTPLTVGYLWVAGLWLVLLPYLPEQQPAEDGVVKRLFQISDALGVGVSITALSFAAYVLGAVATISVENTRTGRLLAAFSPYFLTPTGRDAIQIYYDHLRDDVLAQVVPDAGDSLDEGSAKRLVLSEFASPTTELRTRLLIKNNDVFSEYDRLMSEAEFRLNVTIPLAAMSIYAAFAFEPGWFLVLLLVLGLLLQGTSKLAQSVTVLHRAVTSKVIDHPAMEDKQKAQKAFLEFASGELAATEKSHAAPRSAEQLAKWVASSAATIGITASTATLVSFNESSTADGTSSSELVIVVAGLAVAALSVVVTSLQTLMVRRRRTKSRID